MLASEFRHHADRIQGAIEAGAAASSALVASWQRSSRLHHLDPTNHRLPNHIGDGALQEARERMDRMLRAASANLDRLYASVGGMGCCVLMADRDGVPLERRGAVSDDATFRGWGLWPGYVWTEESEGTNGIGTCLVEQRTVTIHRDQHFFSRNTLLSCTTAPIFDHEGRLAGALDVSSCRSDLTETVVHLISNAVLDAARLIEMENFRQSFPAARILLVPSSDSAPNALVAIGRDDIVVGATRAARRALKAQGDLIGKPFMLGDMEAVPEQGSDAFDVAERLVIERALAKAGGNVSSAARQLGVSRATMHRKLTKFGLDRAGSA